MSDHAHAIDVFAPADELFDYLADASVLPHVLPTTAGASPRRDALFGPWPDDGVPRNPPLDGDSYLRIDRQARRIEWGSGGQAGLEACLLVKELGLAHATLRVDLALHSDRQTPALPAAYGSGDWRLDLQQDLEQGMLAVKHALEHRAS